MGEMFFSYLQQYSGSTVRLETKMISLDLRRPHLLGFLKRQFFKSIPQTIILYFKKNHKTPL